MLNWKDPFFFSLSFRTASLDSKGLSLEGNKCERAAYSANRKSQGVYRRTAIYTRTTPRMSLSNCQCLSAQILLISVSMSIKALTINWTAIEHISSMFKFDYSEANIKLGFVRCHEFHFIFTPLGSATENITQVGTAALSFRVNLQGRWEGQSCVDRVHLSPNTKTSLQWLYDDLHKPLSWPPCRT